MALALINDKRSVGYLVSLIHRERNYIKNEVIFRTLTDLKAEESIKPLIDLVEQIVAARGGPDKLTNQKDGRIYTTSDCTLVKSCLKTMGEIGVPNDSQLVSYFLKFLPYPDVSSAAVIALSKVVTAETKDITAPLCDYIQGDVSQHLYPDQYNDHCFKMLGLAGGTEAIGFLKTLINTKFGNDAYETIEKIHLRNKPLTY